MGTRLILPDFASSATAGRQAPPSPANTESQRLEAYEQGYTAGWEDAARNASDETCRISAGLASQLQDLSFGYHEARSHVLSALQPVLREALGKILPHTARSALPGIVAEHLDSAVREAADAPVFLAVCDADQARIAALLPADPGFPLELRVEQTLAEGQVHLKTNRIETEIDLSRTIAEIETAIDDFFTLDERQAAHG